MARLLPDPADPADIQLDADGRWWHPEMDLIAAARERLQFYDDIHLGDDEVQLATEQDGWLLFALHRTDGELRSGWVSELGDSPGLDLKPKRRDMLLR